ncbi:VOC family protein [archaeon]|nr:VOC family protein [archaeon]
MSRVVHFEINADEPERAVKFYRNVFGWKIEKWSVPVEYWLVTTGKEKPGIDGGIMRRMNREKTVNTIGVKSFDEFARKIKRSGGRQLVKKQYIPGVGHFAYFSDTEGNTFGIMESDKKQMMQKPDSKKKKR